MLYLLIVVLFDRMRLSRWVGSESPTVNPSLAAQPQLRILLFTHATTQQRRIVESRQYHV